MFPVFSPLSWVALAIMVLAVAVAFSKRFIATGALLAANVGVFVLMLADSRVESDLALHGDQLLAGTPAGFLQIFSSMFVHFGFLHILGNMIFLWAFGMPFEERIGARRFMAIYLLSGLVGSLAQFWASTASGEQNVVLMGASGAIFGIMCAFGTKYPNQVIAVPVPAIFFMFFMRMRVVFGILIYVALEVLNVVSQLRDPLNTDNVGHFAHLFGGAAGVVLALALLRHVATGSKSSSIAIDLVALGEFAHDAPTKDVLTHMQQNHDEPEVFQAWLDRFFRTATCPTCSHRVMPRHRGEVVCTQGHTFDVRQDRTQKLAATAAR